MVDVMKNVINSQETLNCIIGILRTNSIACETIEEYNEMASIVPQVFNLSDVKGWYSDNGSFYKWGGDFDSSLKYYADLHSLYKKNEALVISFNNVNTIEGSFINPFIYKPRKDQRIITAHALKALWNSYRAIAAIEGVLGIK